MKSKVDELVKKMEQARKEKLEEAGEYAKDKIKEATEAPKTGETYTIPGTNKTYTASAPGEPVASPTGELRDRIELKIEGEQAGIGSRNAFDEMYEKGGFDDIEARPFINPTLSEEAQAIKRILGSRWF